MSDIFSALRPLLYVSAALGLGPFVIDRDPKSFRVSKWGLAYGSAVLVAFVSSSAIGVYQRIGLSHNTFTYIGEYTHWVLLACGIIVALCILLVSIVQRNKVVAIVHNFSGIDSQMARLDIHMPYDRIFRNSCVITAGLFLLLLALFLHDYCLSDNSFPILFWTAYFAPVIFSTVMQYQFVSGGLLLKKNFNYLNEGLTRFSSEESRAESNRKKMEAMDGVYEGYFESHLIRQTSEHPARAWEGNFSRYRIRKVLPQDSTTTALPPLARIKIIRKVHSNLCEIKELLNSSYSLQLLSTVAQAFVIITTNLYSLFTEGNAPDPATITYPVIWASFRSMELICVTVTCTKISKAANHTAVVVHKLLSQDWDSQIRNQLKLFSIQLLHRKMSFSACGFFTLDMTLLHAIVGAATTYLVILIQFHNTYESQ